MTVLLQVKRDYTVVKNCPIQVARLLEDSLRYLSPKASSYNYAYASGQWDGMVRLYDLFQSRFPTGLLQDVKRILDRERVEYRIEATLPTPHHHHERVYAPEHALWPHQTAALEAAVKWRRGVIQIPTGGGKTETAQAIIDAVKPARVVFFVPGKKLLRQTVARMKAVFPGENIIQWGDTSKPPAGKPPEHYILVCTYQSGFKGGQSPWLMAADMVFCDESHRVAADSFQEAVQATTCARHLFGLSATPWRDDGCDMELNAWIGPIIYRVSYDELIDNGTLVAPQFEFLHSLSDALHRIKGRRAIIFSEHEQPLRDIEPVLIHYNIPVLTGKSKSKDIDDALSRLASGTLNAIAVTPILDEGLDVKAIDTVVFFDTCSSSVRAFQRIGRAMRKFPGKTHCLVIDLPNKSSSGRIASYLKEPAFAKRLPSRTY